ncbi:hypothetical protein CGZ77_01165 [Neisseria sp. KEM232]|nr:hypothetical protein CGZ77_01165 [Neisseria sp. KEM232]
MELHFQTAFLCPYAIFLKHAALKTIHSGKISHKTKEAFLLLFFIPRSENGIFSEKIITSTSDFCRKQSKTNPIMHFAGTPCLKTV